MTLFGYCYAMLCLCYFWFGACRGLECNPMSYALQATYISGLSPMRWAGLTPNHHAISRKKTMTHWTVYCMNMLCRNVTAKYCKSPYSFVHLYVCMSIVWCNIDLHLNMLTHIYASGSHVVRSFVDLIGLQAALFNLSLDEKGMPSGRSVNRLLFSKV